MVSTGVSRFKVLGSTDTVTECDHCGRVDLKKTVRMIWLDEDGNEADEPCHFGVVCAVHMAAKRGIRTTEKQIRKLVEEADLKAARLEQEKRRNAEYLAAHSTWDSEANMLDAKRLLYGRDPVRSVFAYRFSFQDGSIVERVAKSELLSDCRGLPSFQFLGYIIRCEDEARFAGSMKIVKCL